MMMYHKTLSTSLVAICTALWAGQAMANTTLTADGLDYHEGDVNVHVPLPGNFYDWAATLQGRGFLPGDYANMPGSVAAPLADLPEDAHLTKIDLSTLHLLDEGLGASLLTHLINTAQGVTNFIAPLWMTDAQLAQLVRQHGNTLITLNLKNVEGYDGPHNPRVLRETLSVFLNKCTVLETFYAPLTEGSATPQDLASWLKAAPTLSHVEGHFDTSGSVPVYQPQDPTPASQRGNVLQNLEKDIAALSELTFDGDVTAREKRVKKADLVRLFLGEEAFAWLQTYQNTNRAVGGLDFSDHMNNAYYQSFAESIWHTPESVTAETNTNDYWVQQTSTWSGPTSQKTAQELFEKYRSFVSVEDFLLALGYQKPTRGSLGRLLDAYAKAPFAAHGKNRHDLSGLGQLSRILEEHALTEGGATRANLSLTLWGDAEHPNEATTLLFNSLTRVLMRALLPNPTGRINRTPLPSDGGDVIYIDRAPLPSATGGPSHTRGRYTPQGKWKVTSHGPASLARSWEILESLQGERNGGQTEVFFAEPGTTYEQLSTAVGDSFKHLNHLDFSHADLTLDQVWALLEGNTADVLHLVLPMHLTGILAGATYPLNPKATYQGTQEILNALNVPEDQRTAVINQEATSYGDAVDLLQNGRDRAFVMAPAIDPVDPVALDNALPRLPLGKTARDAWSHTAEKTTWALSEAHRRSLPYLQRAWAVLQHGWERIEPWITRQNPEDFYADEEEVVEGAGVTDTGGDREGKEEEIVADDDGAGVSSSS